MNTLNAIHPDALPSFNSVATAAFLPLLVMIGIFLFARTPRLASRKDASRPQPSALRNIADFSARILRSALGLGGDFGPAKRSSAKPTQTLVRMGWREFRHNVPPQNYLLGIGLRLV